MIIPPELLSFLKEEGKFFIATHVNPEGDAIGSSLALSMALESLGKVTVLYDKDSIPEFYYFLPGHEKFTHSIPSVVNHTWPLILLDCNTLERAGIEGLSFKYSAIIDHHEPAPRFAERGRGARPGTEKDFGNIRWIIPEAAATGMMVFYLIKELGINITREMAINLYSAIAIDTGTFRYGNTTAEAFRIAAELIDAGASPAYISNSLYETWSEERFSLLIMALNTLEIRDAVAITVVTREMYKETGAAPEDTESFPNFPGIMKDIKVSALFRELDDNYWKISLRSKGDINVARIATLFEGGGHKNAAGYKIKASLESAKEALLRAYYGHSHKPQQT
ncbi:MAG: bifunctional oligoribonuclease/PAP phosphatase NrnA [Thermodesulfovibrionales bacterium]|nr:bifunctional oligoribonuclease/PAP phosphatase NrnA [Thermodesulfovibrionales bacterium]